MEVKHHDDKPKYLISQDGKTVFLTYYGNLEELTLDQLRELIEKTNQIYLTNMANGPLICVPIEQTIGWLNQIDSEMYKRQKDNG